jgi:hypothetical protein
LERPDGLLKDPLLPHSSSLLSFPPSLILPPPPQGKNTRSLLPPSSPPQGKKTVFTKIKDKKLAHLLETLWKDRTATLNTRSLFPPSSSFLLPPPPSSFLLPHPLQGKKTVFTKIKDKNLAHLLETLWKDRTATLNTRSPSFSKKTTTSTEEKGEGGKTEAREGGLDESEETVERSARGTEAGEEKKEEGGGGGGLAMLTSSSTPNIRRGTGGGEKEGGGEGGRREAVGEGGNVKGQICMTPEDWDMILSETKLTEFAASEILIKARVVFLKNNIFFFPGKITPEKNITQKKTNFCNPLKFRSFFNYFSARG